MRHGLYRSLIIATTTMMLSACAGMTAQQRGTAIGAGIGLLIARHDSESK
jgi:hypothetical protein